jgi:hypothetical protein
MHPPTCLLSFLVISSLLFGPFLCAQDNPLNDPDLKEMLKAAQEMQSQETSEPSRAGHKKEARGNAVPGEGRRSATGAAGKT